MRMPSQPVVLTVEQITELNTKLSTLRHDVNNKLALIMAAAELMHYKPEAAEKMMETLNEQPGKISESLTNFSNHLEKLLGISKI